MIGLDHECRTREECASNGTNASAGDAIGTFVSSNSFASSNSGSDSDPDGSDNSSVDFGDEVELRTYKDDSALRDQQSTGRKRAAIKFPLDETDLCEWSMKKNCGGGKFPIVGCAANLQQARHHGPDKNTLNNDVGNVHRICHSCHNRWHTLNDTNYNWTALHEPHNPVVSTVSDLHSNEKFWDGRSTVKVKD